MPKKEVKGEPCEPHRISIIKALRLMSFTDKYSGITFKDNVATVINTEQVRYAMAQSNWKVEKVSEIKGESEPPAEPEAPAEPEPVTKEQEPEPEPEPEPEQEPEPPAEPEPKKKETKPRDGTTGQFVPRKKDNGDD